MGSSWKLLSRELFHLLEVGGITKIEFRIYKNKSGKACFLDRDFSTNTLFFNLNFFMSEKEDQFYFNNIRNAYKGLSAGARDGLRLLFYRRILT